MVLDESKPCSCTYCNIDFPSKTQLFRHLEEQHGYIGKDSKPTKVVLLVGWLASPEARDTEQWVKDAPLNCSGHDSPLDVKVEAALVRALAVVDARYGDTESTPNISEDVPFERPKGFCRCSSSTQRNSYLLSVEDTCHRSCDVIGYQGKRIPGGRQEEMKWVDEVNELLPETIRVLGRYTLPSSASQFHAEMNCSQRVFEYMLPLNIAMPSHLAVAPKEKIVRRTKQAHDRGAWSEMDIVFPSDTDEGQARIAFFRNLKKILKRLIGRQFLHNFATGGASPDEAASARKLDRVFHKDLVTINGQDWVVFSASGDSFLRGQVRHLLGLVLAICWGWLPPEYLDSALSPDIVCDVPALPGCGLTLSECRYSLWEAKQFYRLDPRRVLDKSQVFETDTTRLDDWAVVVQTHTANLMNTQGYDWVLVMREKCCAALMKAQAVAVLTARTHLTLAEGLVTVLSEHDNASTDARTYTAEEIVRDGSVSLTAGYGRASAGSAAAPAAGDDDIDIDAVPDVIDDADKVTFAAKAEGADTEVVTDADTHDIREVGEDGTQGDKPKGKNKKFRKDRKNGDNTADRKGDNSASRPPNKKQKKTSPKKPVDIDAVEDDESPIQRAPPQPQSLYWRQPLPAVQTDALTQAPEAYRKVLRLLREADASGLWPLSSVARQKVMDSEMNQKQGGTFSVGALPKHMTQPKGNILFPELMKACFELERALCPHRIPSATIAINRHAQFRPHRDSGAGNGQSISLIVALGDFVGGEIAVEGQVHDIRYQPLEFDGWKERHWTLPFVGERYSLVWFTPLGVTQEDLWWWREDANNTNTAAAAGGAAGAAGGMPASEGALNYEI